MNSDNRMVFCVCCLGVLAGVFLCCSPVFALGTNASFEPDPAAVKAAKEEAAVKEAEPEKMKNPSEKNEKMNEKQALPPRNDIIEKPKGGAAKELKPVDAKKPKETVNGDSTPSVSEKPRSSEKPANEYIRGY